jgi:O-antigen/teichoic acid export membrane protein
MAWNSSWQPKLYQLINERKTEKINKVNNSTAVMIFIITSICILFSKEMVIIMADEKYYAGIDIVPLIMIGNSLIYIYLTYVNFVFYKKKTALISVTTLIALGINIVTNYKLIPLYGIMGAAVATLIAYLALCFFHYCTARYLIGIYDQSLIKLKSLFYYFTGLIIIYIIMYVINKEPVLISLPIKISVMAIMIAYIFKTKKYKDMVV